MKSAVQNKKEFAEVRVFLLTRCLFELCFDSERVDVPSSEEKEQRGVGGFAYSANPERETGSPSPLSIISSSNLKSVG